MSVSIRGFTAEATAVSGVHVLVLFVGIVALADPVMALSDADPDPENRSPDVEVLDAVDEVELDQGILNVSVPDDLYAYHEAYVSDAEDVTEEEIAAWETVRVDASTVTPGQVWDPDFGDDSILFSDSGDIHLARYFESGAYYVFLWGCDTMAETGVRVPGDCRWIEPMFVDFQNETDILANDLAVTYRDDRYEYNPDEDSDHDWTLDGEETDLIVEEHDYIEIHTVPQGDVRFADYDPTVPPGDRAYNSDAQDLLFNFENTGTFTLRHVAGGEVEADITVRECGGGQTWNGEECRDMYNLVAVPFNYPQTDFDVFLEDMERIVFEWADAVSPLGQEYSDPRDVMKIHFLEPDEEYRYTDSLSLLDPTVPELEEDDGESTTLSNPHTDICHARGPHTWCLKDPEFTCIDAGGEFSLDQAAVVAARHSPFNGVYDDVVGMHHGDMRNQDMTGILQYIDEGARYAGDGGPEEDLADSISEYSEGEYGCGGIGTAAVISDESPDQVRQLGHELGHVMGICHTPGRDRDGACDEEVWETADYHLNIIQACVNDPFVYGERDIMNYCPRADDRYWGHPDVGGDPDDMDLPYAIVHQWMDHHIEGGQIPSGFTQDVLERRGVERAVVAKLSSARLVLSGEALDILRSAYSAARDAGSGLWDTLSGMAPWTDDEEDEEPVLEMAERDGICEGTPDLECDSITDELTCEAMGCDFSEEEDVCREYEDAPERGSCSVLPAVNPSEQRESCETVEGCTWRSLDDRPEGNIR